MRSQSARASSDRRSAGGRRWMSTGSAQVDRQRSRTGGYGAHVRSVQCTVSLARRLHSSSPRWMSSTSSSFPMRCGSAHDRGRPVRILDGAGALSGAVFGGRDPAHLLSAPRRHAAGAVARRDAAGVRVHDQGVAADHPHRDEPDLSPSEASAQRGRARRRGRVSRIAGRGRRVARHRRGGGNPARERDPVPVSSELPSERREPRRGSRILRAHRSPRGRAPDARAARRQLDLGARSRALRRGRRGACRGSAGHAAGRSRGRRRALLPAPRHDRRAPRVLGRRAPPARRARAAPPCRSGPT